MALIMMVGLRVLIVCFALIPLLASGAGIDRLSFMAGHWVGGKGENYEEVWLEPKSGTITGSFRWVFDNGRQVLEFIVIEETDEGIFLRFKHFHPDYVPWEKDEPNIYKLSSVEGMSATFERVTDNSDVPKTLSYSRDGDMLRFRGTGDDPEDVLLLTFTLRD